MSDPQIILHHYQLSPYSEKIRTLLGYCGLPWHSVIESSSLPRPELMQMTGGYRRIPVLQIGADIYCDSRVIARKLAELSGKQALFTGADGPLAQRNAFADGRLFQIAMTGSLGWRALKTLRPYMSTGEALRLLWDRIKMAKGAKMPRIGPTQAKLELHDFLREMEADLGDGFVAGKEPTIVDFSIYHCLHFSQLRCGAGHLKNYPQVRAWLQRMIDIGHGEFSEMTRKQALKIAAGSEPLSLDSTPNEQTDSGEFKLGDHLRIRPSDYGMIPVEGELVASTPYSWVLRRELPNLGRVHVHFSRLGFALEKI